MLEKIRKDEFTKILLKALKEDNPDVSVTLGDLNWILDMCTREILKLIYNSDDRISFAVGLLRFRSRLKKRGMRRNIRVFAGGRLGKRLERELLVKKQ
ncbi:MAG: hypothetical protein C0180_00355 [Aciduliprofundum sp.]|nr:MAG: hypothetical protein C0180_00355 [Aciduliprofundum sp.]